MRKRLGKMLIAIAVTVIAASGADNSVGTWKLNVEKSKSSLKTFPLKSLTTTREAVAGGVKVTTNGERFDSTAVHVSYTEKYTGATTPFEGSGAPYDTVSIKQIDANTFIDEQKKTGGAYHTTGRTVISHDGKTMTVTRQGTYSDGTPFRATYIYEKQ